MADDNKEPSIEEILAAARQQDGGEEAAAPEPNEETAAEAPAESAPAADKPAGEMSVEDIFTNTYMPCKRFEDVLKGGSTQIIPTEGVVMCGVLRAVVDWYSRTSRQQ